ncbi:hypothetical protein D3C71_1030650 [compost metagenome]
MDERIDRLLSLAEHQHATIVEQGRQNAQQHATIVEQGRQIAQQAEHIGLLAQSVVLLLGEEVGVPVPDGEAAAEPPRTDMDGNPY